MTTIAADLTSMSADTKVTDDITDYYTTKIFVMGDAIVGAAGNVDDTNLFFDWVRGGLKLKDKPAKVAKNFNGIMLTRKGLFYFQNFARPDRVEPHPVNGLVYYAIGNGAQAAMAMLSDGHSSHRAIEKAIEINTAATGGRIDTLAVASLPPLKTPSARKRTR